MECGWWVPEGSSLDARVGQEGKFGVMGQASGGRYGAAELALAILE
jgi:hypothetical protein